MIIAEGLFIGFLLAAMGMGTGMLIARYVDRNEPK